MAIITVSRGTFSGGARIAECLASRLGYDCVSREVLLDAAQRYGVSAEVLANAIQKPPSFFDRIGKDRDHYLAYVRAALTQRALAGHLVYHGHGGHFLLAGIQHVIRARVVAPMEYRVQAAMQALSVTHPQAIAHIEKVDRERMKWTQFLYHVDWRDPDYYDVVLNLEKMDADVACGIIADMVKLPTFQPTAESQLALRNLALKSAVAAVIAADPRTGDADPEIIADDGVVTLRGWAKLQSTVDLLPQIVQTVEGIKEVKSELALRPHM